MKVTSSVYDKRHIVKILMMKWIRKLMLKMKLCLLKEDWSVIFKGEQFGGWEMATTDGQFVLRRGCREVACTNGYHQVVGLVDTVDWCKISLHLWINEPLGSSFVKGMDSWVSDLAGCISCRDLYKTLVLSRSVSGQMSLWCTEVKFASLGSILALEHAIHRVKRCHFSLLVVVYLDKPLTKALTALHYS